MKKLLVERFQELAGIKPLYTEQRRDENKTVSWEEYKKILKNQYNVYTVEDGNQLIIDAGMANELNRFKDVPTGPINVKRVPIGWFLIMGAAIGLKFILGLGGGDGGGGGVGGGSGPGSGMGGTWPPEPPIW